MCTWCSPHTCGGQVVALTEDSYSEFIDKCSTATFAAAALCACILVALFLLPVMAPRQCPGGLFNILVTSVIALATLVGLFWIGQTSTWHRDAVDDLMHQLARSMDTQLLASLQASIKMVKEAHNTWSFTGVYMHHDCSACLSESGSCVCRGTSIHSIRHERLVHSADGRLLLD